MKKTNLWVKIFILVLCVFGIWKASLGADVKASQIFDSSGRFLITEGMLDVPYNEITFPGTHNSAANDADGVLNYSVLYQNQAISMKEQLQNGIRMLDLDFGPGPWINTIVLLHNNWSGGYSRIDTGVRSIKEWVEEVDGKQVLTLGISDVKGVERDKATQVFLKNVEDEGLMPYVYNVEKVDGVYTIKVPDPWPTLGDMINSGKPIMILSDESDKNDKNRKFTEGNAYRGLSYSDNVIHAGWQAKNMEELSLPLAVYEPGSVDNQNGSFYDKFSDRERTDLLLTVGFSPDSMAAGDANASLKNNHGYRLYQYAKYYENLLPNNRVVTSITVDYFRQEGYIMDIDVVRAANKLNFERFGYSWDAANAIGLGDFDVYPFQGEVNLIAASASSDVSGAYQDLANKNDLGTHKSTGAITTNSYYTKYDWKTIGEFGADGDLMTRWCGANSNDGKWWQIRFDNMVQGNTVAIAWEFSNRPPQYEVHVSNDGQNWRRVIDVNDSPSDINRFWDIRTFNQDSFKYLKVTVTNSSKTHWPSFYNIMLFNR